jgi:hypothetical protein
VTPQDLPGAWRAEAARLERYSPAAAEAFRTAADELDQAQREHGDELLTLERAATESGYAKRTIREMVADGRIANAGRKNAPRVRRVDLPVKPGAGPAAGNGAYNVAADAAELAGRLT